VILSSGATVIRRSALFVGDILFITCCSFTLHKNLDVTLFLAGEALRQLTI
jgi:hypothetical protein